MIASTMTACTMVNAAFLQELKESNAQFWATINGLRSVLCTHGETRSRSVLLVRLLSELRVALAQQFSLEETYGYIEGNRSAPLITAARAVMAKQQHRELYLQLHEILERAEEAQYRGTIGDQLTEILDACSDFLTVFDAHEALESELIQGCLGLTRKS